MLLLDVLLVVVFDEVFEFKLAGILKTKGSFEWLSQINARMYILQEILQVDKFFVSLIKFKRNNGNAIAELVTKAPDSIIDQNHILEVDIVDNSEVLDIHVICCFDATFSVQSVLE